MNSVFSAIKKIFSGISASIKWFTQDDARLREARERALGRLDERPDEVETAGDNKPDVPEDFIDPWDEIDNVRYSMWVGGRLGRKLSKQRRDKRIERKLKKAMKDEVDKGENSI